MLYGIPDRLFVSFKDRFVGGGTFSAKYCREIAQNAYTGATSLMGSKIAEHAVRTYLVAPSRDLCLKRDTSSYHGIDRSGKARRR